MCDHVVEAVRAGRSPLVLTERNEHLNRLEASLASHVRPDARLDTLFLTLPVSWRGTIPQYAGRLYRASLDAFAWLAWLRDKPVAPAVQRWLDDAERGRADCVTSIINLGEAFYMLVRVNRRELAESLWRYGAAPQLPVSVKEATQRRATERPS